jgi:hypothetical protein
VACSRVNCTVPLYDYRFLLHHSHFPIRNGVVISVSEVTDCKLKGRCEILCSGTVTGVTFPGFTQPVVYCVVHLVPSFGYAASHPIWINLIKAYYDSFKVIHSVHFFRSV